MILVVPDASTHKLSYDEWAATGFHGIDERYDDFGFVQFRGSPTIFAVTGYRSNAENGRAISYDEWQRYGFPTPELRAASRAATPPTTAPPVLPPPYQPPPITQPPVGNCHSSYPTTCIPPAPPDLDCDDVSARRFVVRPPDPHGFDADGDGIGCEG